MRIATEHAQGYKALACSSMRDAIALAAGEQEGISAKKNRCWIARCAEGQLSEA